MRLDEVLEEAQEVDLAASHPVAVGREDPKVVSWINQARKSKEASQQK
jgi:hypothetical protein